MANGRLPGEGERQALSGYVPQYKLFAAEILRALRRRTLVAISVADPEAARLDDIQVETARRIDAFQIKWTTVDDPITVGDFRRLLQDMAEGRAALEKGRRLPVVAHTQTNRPLSAHTRNQVPELDGGSLSLFFQNVWRPATLRSFAGLAEVPARWHRFLELLAGDVGLSAAALLEEVPSLRFEHVAALPEEDAGDDREAELYLRDLRDLTSALFDVVSERDRHLVRIETEQLLRRVGGDWPERGRFRASGSFPLRPVYKEISASAMQLEFALQSHTSGYIFLLGSPGSGKSTLLTQLLRSDDRLAASYYAYVPGDNTATRSEASTFLHDLVLTLEERGFAHGKSEPPIDDVDLLRNRLSAQLDQLASEARRQSGVAVVLIDGLDHVEREPTPRVSLLQYLPDPREIPDGVVFLIGTRSPNDLPGHIQPAVRQSDRVIEIDRLSREAVLAIAEPEDVQDVGELIWRLSEGHPLLMWTFVRLAQSLSERERESRLSQITPVDGDVGALYEQLWQEILNDADLVELLALVARIRVPFAPSWLEQTGSEPATVRKLEALRHLIDTDDFNRSIFFHDSFRVFVRDRTAERLGTYDPELDRARNLELAERCASTPAKSRIAWEEIHHRLAAGDYEGALERARPEFFRAQITALRPLSQVGDAIREAAGALAYVQDGNAVMRLAMAASEVQSRSYNVPSGTDMLIALSELGWGDVAIEQLDDIRDTVVGNDRRASAMEFALYLHDAGHHRAALRVFEAYEPLHLFGGPGATPQMMDGPWKILRAWAPAAATIRGAEHVVHAVERLDLPEDRFDDDGDPAQLLRSWRAYLLILAAQSAVARVQDPAPYLGNAEMLVEVGSGLWVDLRVIELERCPDATRQSELREELADVSMSDLEVTRAINIVETLERSGATEAAARAFRQILQPVVPQGSGLRDDVTAWETLYRFFRLQSLYDGPFDPITSIPDAEQTHGQGAVLVARHLAVMASLDGSARAGRHVSESEPARASDRFFAFWQGSSTDIGMSLLRGARELFIRQAVATTTRLGQPTLRKLFESFEARWDELPHSLRSDGWTVIQMFARAGIGETSIAKRLGDLEALELEVEERLENVLGWIEIGRGDRARNGLQQMIARTLVVGYRKDYQLSEWIELLRPRLIGTEGDRDAKWIAEKLVELDDELEGGATHDAALRLIAIRAERSLAAAHRVAAILSRGQVIDVDDTLRSLLEVSANDGTPVWWIALRDLLCPLGVRPPTAAAVSAAAAAAAAAALHIDVESELRETARRVSIEGKPSLRLAWRGALAEAAHTIGTTASAIGISQEDLMPGDETPQTRRGSNDTSAEEETRGLDELIRDYEAGVDDYRIRTALVGALADAPEDTVERILRAAVGREEETALRAAAAMRYFASDHRDAAWAQAKGALLASNGRDWSRSWAGGPVLASIHVMQEIDFEVARAPIFTRFAELAAQDSLLLAEVAREMPQFVDVFAHIDQTVLADDVSDYLEELIGSPGVAGVSSSGDLDDALPLVDVVRGVIVELLGSPYRLAWTTAQRAALEMHRRSYPSSALIVDAFDDERVPRGRCLALADAEITEERALDRAVVAKIADCAAGEALDIRLAAERLLSRLGIAAPPRPHSPLPNSLRIELPARLGDSGTMVGEQARAIEEIIETIDYRLDTVADAAGIDVDALRVYVTQRALQTPEANEIDRARPHSVFGWAYIKPAARAVFRALSEVAGVLVDADQLPTADATRLFDLTSVYDPYLLLNRPARKPAEIATAGPLETRSYHQDDWLRDVATAEERVVEDVVGWIVIGEVTLLRQLSRQLPEELRTQTLTLGSLAEIDHASPRLTAATARRLSREPEASLLVRGTYIHLDTEHDWLALHPVAAAAAGFVASTDDALAWMLDGQVAIRSLWWRSGFPSWEPYSDEDEVSEGWLVLATDRAAACLREAFPDAEVMWEFVRSWRPKEKDTDERKLSGRRAL
jgi:hypothetical protein